MRRRLLLGVCAIGLAVGLLGLWALGGWVAPTVAAPVRRMAGEPVGLNLADASPTHYVATTGADSGDCSTPSGACRRIQYAVDQAGEGDEVRVAGGTYTGVQTIPELNGEHFTATQVVAVDKSLTLRGGYATDDWSTSDPSANPTVLDAQGGGRVLVVIGNADATLQGLRLVGGDCGNLGGETSKRLGETWSVGGGVYAVTATVTLSGCQVSNNVAPDGKGGAMYGINSGLRLFDSLIADNAGVCTAGVFLRSADGSEVLGNTFSGNDSTGYNCYTGGGLSVQGDNILVKENSFTDNDAYGGGALGIEGDVRVSKNVITGNRAIYGGGIHIRGGSTLVESNVISGNQADYSGGGIATWDSCLVHPCVLEPTLVNNIVVDNQLGAYYPGWGPGIFVAGGNPTLIHNTVARNTGGDGSGVAIRPWMGNVAMTMTNSILVSHTVGISVTSGNTVTVDGVLWHRSPITLSKGAGANVTVRHERKGDPAFADDGYHITSGSAALDAGVASDLDSDVDGDVRWFGDAPDLGADEWATSEATATPGQESVLSATADGLTTTVGIPGGAVTESTDLRLTARAAPEEGALTGYTFASRAFSIDAYRNGGLLETLTFEKPVTVTIHYADDDLGMVGEDSLTLMVWNGSAWEDAACGDYDRHPDENWLRVPICHLSGFALFGETHRIYLPLVLRDVDAVD